LKLTNIKAHLLFSLLTALGVGAIVAALSPGGFWRGWLAAALLCWLGFFGLLRILAWAEGGKGLAWMTALAFFLRLGVGLAMHQALPIYGYPDEPTQHAGYVFYDAYRRDLQSWDLAQSGESLLDSFGRDFYADQYGGLLALSAALYRYLSPDAHRPALILPLGAFATALGLPFFWKGVRKRWDGSVAAAAGWILALYPDGILFGASQMREPFLVGLTCIAFWAVLTFFDHRRSRGVILAASFLGMVLISWRVALVIAGILTVWFWIEYLLPRSQRWRILGWVVLALGVLGLAYLSWEWFRSAAQLDIKLTTLESGWVKKVIDEVGRQWTLPFVLGYGLAQPILPAAIAEPTIPIWRIIAVPRAAGWYILAPFLLYAFFAIWRVPQPAERRILGWLVGFVFLWILISSARAGGDLWDNPRYRSIFLPWLALLAGWGAVWAVRARDTWLARWLIVEGIFLYYFTNWYFSRHLLLWKRLPFWQNVLRITLLSALVLGSGWLWDLGKVLWRRYKKG